MLMLMLVPVPVLVLVRLGSEGRFGWFLGYLGALGAAYQLGVGVMKASGRTLDNDVSCVFVWVVGGGMNGLVANSVD